MVSSCLSSGLGFWGPSNRSAIGARVCLEAGGRKQYREVSGGSNFGCLPFEQHFGLAAIVRPTAKVTQVNPFTLYVTLRFSFASAGLARFAPAAPAVVTRQMNSLRRI